MRYNFTFAQHIIAANEILWEITKDEIDKKSYILGTFHEATNNTFCYEYLDTLVEFKSVLEQVSAVCIESNSDDKKFQKVGIDYL